MNPVEHKLDNKNILRFKIEGLRVYENLNFAHCPWNGVYKGFFTSGAWLIYWKIHRCITEGLHVNFQEYFKFTRWPWYWVCRVLWRQEHEFGNEKIYTMYKWGSTRRFSVNKPFGPSAGRLFLLLVATRVKLTEVRDVTYYMTILQWSNTILGVFFQI